MFLASYICRYDSCRLRADVQILRPSFHVRLEFTPSRKISSGESLRKSGDIETLTKSQTNNRSGQGSYGTHIRFVSHDEPSLQCDGRQVKSTIGTYQF